MLGRLGRNSLIYTAGNVLLRGINFFLLPLYTRFLRPEDFGILSLVTVLNWLFSILFTFSLHGAVTRFYFEYRDQPQRLREFLGTVLTFILLTSVSVGLVVLIIGPVVLTPLLGDVPFWPFVALGVLATIFQPFFYVYLALLQTREEALRFTVLNALNVFTTLALILFFVVFAGLGATGPLLANAIVALIFFCLALYLMRRDVVFGLRREYLQRALSYSLPLVPHNVAGQLQFIFDRFVLNRLMGPGLVGVYQVGYLFGGLIGVVSDAVNRAYVPLTMSVFSEQDKVRRSELRELGLTVIAGYCLLAAGVALFAPEGVWLLTAPPYRAAATLVPVLAFSFATGGVCSIFVTVLFFEKHATRFIMVSTFGGALTSIACNLTLVPRMGALGSAVSSLAAQVVAAAIAATIGGRFDPVRWPHARITLALAGGLCVSIVAVRMSTPPSLTGVGVKILILAALYGLYNLILWGELNHLGQHLDRLIALWRSRRLSRSGAQ
jgi:O-antigen/teichoic acid export membrane protein